ncbi:dihydroorotate dehydrogenase electron transfer subunit [Cupriavidus pinatubonensis]|uniref:Dihydroorotate dehydrogenase B (NAD(+)), electron transfer subunit n=1 Tax=Cupriavidus pinatubonensis TaxID=248026 RepID=A0ABM8Y499_9BURK|nr:dihydroorotate dehydrogenase electron transfer subunit [Cupriavidus pinatubonensis]CAG9187580.1 Dihydroorotate dehydrogenase B (NAD(+)), electron transfer subunit [Cupriavidus pinatubonensis]
MLQQTMELPSASSAGEKGCCSVPTFSVAENICLVKSNEWVNGEYKHLVLDADDVALTALPGQFFHLQCPPGAQGEALLRRPMSLYRVNQSAREVEFLYKVQGRGTGGLATLVSGDHLNALGPVGKGFVLPANTKHVLLLARGVGLATLTPLAEFARAMGASVTAVLSARSHDLIMSADYLRGVGASVRVVTDEDGTSAISNVDALIRDEHSEQPFDFVATCGSNRLLTLLQDVSRELGITGQIAVEQHMGCALGACYACVRPFRKGPETEQLTYRRVCWDGPVFDLQETVSW